MRHISPSVFDRHSNPPPLMANNDGNYPMSRSTSGASDAEQTQRLLTPHYEYREQLSPAAADLRKVSDNVGGYMPRYASSDRYTPGPPGYPQPAVQYWGRDAPGGHHHFDGGKYQQEQQQQQQQRQQQQQQQEQQQQHELPVVPENEYERERLEQISGNRKLLEDLGLGGGPTVSKVWTQLIISVRIVRCPCPMLGLGRSLLRRRGLRSIVD